MEHKKKLITPVAETKAAEGEDRTLVVTITTDKPDRSGDVVVPEGGDLKNFKKNPVVLFGHKYNEPPIARAEQLRVVDNGIQAKVSFPEKGVYPFADTIYELYKAKILHAWSIGFIAKESVNLDAEKGSWGPQKFTKWEMLEFSAVPVPANPEALTLLRSNGLDESTIKHLTIDSAETKEEEKDPEDDTETLEISGLSYDPLLKQMTVVIENNAVVYELAQEELEALSDAFTDKEKPEDQTDLIKAMTTLRDSLRPADKEIGLALRTLKTLLNNTSGEGGEK